MSWLGQIELVVEKVSDCDVKQREMVHDFISPPSSSEEGEPKTGTNNWYKHATINWGKINSKKRLGLG